MMLPVMTAEPVYRIAEVERAAVFAGRLGQRITETLIVDVEGRKVRIVLLGAYHSRAVAGNARFRAGDEIRLGFPIRSDEMRAPRDEVRRVRRA